MISRVQNNQKTSFKRGFEAKEVHKLLDRNPRVLAELAYKIGTGEIRAQDGALRQLNVIPKHMFESSKDYQVSLTSGKTSYRGLITNLLTNPNVAKKSDQKLEFKPSFIVSLKFLEPRTITSLLSGAGRGDYSLSTILRAWKKADKLSAKNGARPSIEAILLRQHIEKLNPSMFQKIKSRFKSILGAPQPLRTPSNAR